MPKPNGVAVVGSGYWGKNHVRVFHELGALTHICEIESTVLEKCQDQYDGVVCTSRYEDVLADPNIRAVVLATPAVTHFELARAALEAGKDVLVEKPLSLNVSDGQKLVDSADRMNSVLMVGHILLHHPAVEKLKGMVDSGELGKIQSIQSNRLSFGKVRSEENILWSFAPHDISVILYLLGEMPEEISAIGYSHLQKDIEDVTISALNFPSGVAAHIYVSWMNPFKEQRLVLIGDRKMGVFEDSRPDKKLQLFNNNFQWVGRQPVASKGSVEEVSYEPGEPLKLQATHFLDCVRERKRPRSDGHEGLRTLKVLQACYESMKERVHPRVVPMSGPESQERGFFAHDSAVIDEPVSIGKGTKIWHFSHVMPGAEIGEQCNIGQNVLVGRGVKIGNKCKIQNNVAVYEGVTLEDFVFCGPSMVFTNVFNPRCEIPRMNEIRPTLVKKGVTIGANATIVCGITIGEYAFIGAGAVVNRDVGAYALMVGNPARHIGSMCRCGKRLMGTDSPGEKISCQVCGATYSLNLEGHASLEIGAQVPHRIPLLDLKGQYGTLKTEVKSALDRVLDSQHFILGPEVEALEREVAEYCGSRYAIGVSSGTDALITALMALGIGPGDEVITTPFTFFATVGSILRVGADVVFADIEPDSYNIDPKAVEAAITSKTKAIIPVHLFGQVAAMGHIMALAEQHGLSVIEDAAQAIGAELDGKRAGTFGVFGCFSFFPSKNLGGFGDGGMVVTDDEQLAVRLRIIRNQGAMPKYHHKIVGGNFRLDALQAAVLRVKLRHLDEWTEKRNSHAEYYTKRFHELGLTQEMVSTPDKFCDRHVFNQYVIRATGRDELRRHLDGCGISTEIYYPGPLHLQECMQQGRYRLGDYPISETACQSVLALPVFPELTREQQDRVSGSIAQFYKEGK
jgi:UDP-2-acetamido-3-amino-2,3-dideoxy-glucuronate N-acetyltransferase